MYVINAGETICVALDCDKEHGPEVVSCKDRAQPQGLKGTM